MGGLTLNAMVFKHSKFPNAAKAFLAFMLESEQYEPWLNANSGYWSQPLNAYREAAVWSGDPKVALFKDAMQSQFYTGYKGPISQASGAVNADYVLVQMLRVGRDRRSDAGGGRRRSRTPRQALLSPRGLSLNHGVMPGHSASVRSTRTPCAGHEPAKKTMDESGDNAAGP